MTASVPEDTRRTCSSPATRDGHGFGEQHLAGRRCAEGRALAGRVAQRLDDDRVGVAEQRRAVGLDVVEVALCPRRR